MIAEETLFSNVASVLAGHVRVETKLITKRAMARKKQRGELTGDAPIGSKVADDGKTLVPNPIEAKAIAFVLRQRENGVSFRKITSGLNDLGFPCRGARWHLSTVHKIAKRIEMTNENKIRTCQNSSG